MMTVEGPAKNPVISNGDGDDDDDEPCVFKRHNASSSKQNSSNSESKKVLSQRPDGQSVRKLVSGVRSPNVQTTNAQMGKKILPSKSPPMRSPLASPKASMSPVKSPPPKSPPVSSKVSSSSDGHMKQAVKQNVSRDIKVEKSPMKAARADSDDESDDNKPISSRIKGNSTQNSKSSDASGSKTVLKPEPKTEEESDSSDDDVPLSAKLGAKSSAGASTSKPHGSNEKKALASKGLPNGFVSKEKLQKPSMLPVKRPLDKGVSFEPISSKKPKPSDASTSSTVKKVAVKPEVKVDDDDEDHIPISERMKCSASSNVKSSSVKQKATKVVPKSFKKTNIKSKKDMKNFKYIKSTKALPSSSDGQKKWTTLVHSGVIFPPPYQPHRVKMLYEGKPVDLTPEQEEVATMFAVMKDTDYMNKPQFKKNFWVDWSKILGKNHVIKNLEKCDFTPIYEWHQKEKEKKKQLTSDEKKALKEEKLKLEEKFMWAVVDGVKEKVGNFRVEPPGLFRGRGEHPKMGKLKRRICPNDITINIGKDAPMPECPIPGERWKDIKHDNTVTWLAFWNDPINSKEFKYVFLAASSSLKGQSDKEKYEKARMLKGYIKNIRAAYTRDFTSRDVMKRQIAVATYLIDKLALRAGNEKDDDEADTVGCCTLKIGNVECIPPNQLKFDFLGKDSIQYVNTVEVELPVYKAIGQFQARGKTQNDFLFDELDTSKLNAHLKELMPGLTAKVFRTYNASITLDDMLNKETKEGDVPEKVGVYQRANKEVAIICNHQRSVSKSHTAQMSRLTEKIDELKGVIKELKVDLDRARKGKPPLKDSEGKKKRNLSPEALEKKIAQTKTKIDKFERDMLTKEDLKTVALGTSKINYMDPRITVAWCKRHEVPIEKIFNKSLLAKFAWAMDVDPDFRF